MNFENVKSINIFIEIPILFEFLQIKGELREKWSGDLPELFAPLLVTNSPIRGRAMLGQTA
jgi:hypothetical protein